MKKLLAMTLTVVMSAAVLAGCSGSQGAGAPEAASQETPAATEQQTEEKAPEAPAQETATESTGDAAAADSSAFDLSSVSTVEEGKLIFGTNAAFPPFEYVGDDGQPDGFDMALIKAVGDKLGVEVEIQDMEFASLVTSIGSKIDGAIAGMTVTEERKAMVDFSDSYYDAVQYVLLPAGSEVATADDLKGKNIGVQLGTTGNFIADEIEGASVNSYDKAVDAVNDLVNGRNDVVIVDKNPAMVFESNFEGKIVAVDGAQFDFEPEQYAIALPKDSELTAAVNSALEALKADGTYDALVKQYIEGE